MARDTDNADAGDGGRGGEQTGHFVFITGAIEWEPFTSAADVAQALASARLWLVSPQMPFRKTYERGDRALFYASGAGARCFLGDAVLGGPVTEIGPEGRRLARELGLAVVVDFEEQLPLERVRLWPGPVPLKPLVPDLAFLKDKEHYGLHLRRAAARMPASDYEHVLKQAGR